MAGQRRNRSANASYAMAMDNLISDLRYAVRTFVRNPAFTAVAVISLALGIGVNVVIFSVVNTVLAKPMAGAADPDRLMRM